MRKVIFELEVFGLKKASIVFSLIFSVMLVMTCVASAAGRISMSEVSLGGISIGSSMDYVRSVYGEPTKIKTDKTPYQSWSYYRYGNSVELAVLDNDNTVHEIQVTANNGFATPAGVTVGMDRNTLYSVYGRPMSSNSTGCFYSASADCGLTFTFNSRTGKITKIVASY